MFKILALYPFDPRDNRKKGSIFFPRFRACIEQVMLGMFFRIDRLNHAG